MPAWVAALPAVNASLNGLATALLIAGYFAIRRKQVAWHQSLMLTAFATSIAFLACYLAYHWGLHHYTGEAGKKFAGSGVVRPIYFTILITHVVLAAAVPVLAVLTIRHAWRGRWEAHRRIARITFPIWVYVSVTGVVIYGMLYHWPV